MLASGNAANAAMSQNMQKTLINSVNATGKFAASLTNIKSSAENFTTSLEKNKLGLREYFRYAGASTQSFGKLFKSEFATIEKVATERVKTLQTQYIKMGRDANGALQAIKVRPLSLDMQNLATQTAIAAQKQQLLNQLIKQGTTNLVNWGKNVQWAGRQLMVGFTLPLAVLGTTAAKSFMELEKQAVRFKRVYGEMFTSSGETEKALEDVRKLADEFTRYGVAVEKTLGLAADLAQQGFAGVALMSQVTQATRLAVLGEVEQQEALQTTISITNAFGIAAEDLASKINFLNAVENQTVTAIEDLTIAIPKAGPVIQQLGGDVEDLAFFLTAMKEGGINASEGANALKSGLASLINPSEKASEFLGSLGVNIKGIVDANKGDVQGIVVQFAKALDDLDPLNRAQAIEQLFGKFQFSRLSTLFQNVIKEGSQANRVLQLGQQTAEELAVLADRELKKVEDSPAFKFQKAIEDITVAIAPLGEQFLKLITPVVEFVTEMLKKFNDMSEGSKTFVAGLIATLGLVAPVLLMTVGLVANGVGNLIKGFNALRLFYNKLGGDSSGLASSTQYLTQEQLEAAAVAASLGQSHAQLAQIFTSETQAVQGLIAAYQQAVIAANALSAVAPVARARPEITVTTNSRGGRRAQAPQGYKDGVVSVPGPKGAGDVVPAMLSPGEAVIPAEQTEKYGALIAGIVADNIPGYRVSNVRNVRSKLDLDAQAMSRYDEIGSYNYRRSRTAETSSSIINEQVPGGGEELQAILAESGIAKKEAIRIMSQGADLVKKARGNTKEALESYSEYLEVVRQTALEARTDAQNLVSDSEDFRSQLDSKTGYESAYKPKTDNVLAHMGSMGGFKFTAKEIQDLVDSGDLNLTPGKLEELQKIVLENPKAKMDLKTGFGITGITDKTNKELAGKGAPIEKFTEEFISGGLEKWDVAIKSGGGNVEELASQTAVLDTEFQRLLASVERGTLIFDSEAQVAEARLKGQKAVSLEGLAATARTNTRARTPDLDNALTTAQGTAIQLRGQGKYSSIDTSGYDPISSKPIQRLQEQATKENSIYLSELSAAADKAQKEVSEQTNSTSALSTAVDAATQNSKQLTSSVNSFGTEAVETANQIQNASNIINSSGARRAIAAQGPPTPLTTQRVFANKGLLSVPGPKGAGDVVPAMLSPGEAVIPAKIAEKYAPFIQDMIAGNIPGFMSGVMLGMPKSSKAVSKGRVAGDEIYELFKKSSYANTPPTEYGHQISPTSGHSFPIFGLGGVYQKGAKQVFVKPVMDETAAMAEMRATTIARQAHGLKAPEQRIVVIRDPMDVKRERRFLALESDLDPTFVNTEPMGVFNEEQYFRQLAASLLRADKDLSPANVYGDVVADVGPAGVFDRASGLRQYSSNLPSMEDQALINLLGIKGGAKRAFAESTLGLMSGMTAEQYHQRMIAEIQKVLPKLKATIASFGLTNPTDIGMYDDMVRRLEAGLSVDWRKFHTVHSSVVIPKPKKIKEPAGYAKGVVSVPGPKGAGDVVPAMLSPGEAVIPAAMAEKYGPLINSMISGNIPGYEGGLEAADSEKAERDQRRADRKETVQRVSGRISQIGMMGSMGVGAASMVPGVVGEIAQQLAAPIMALSTLAMFIQGPVTAGLVAFIAVIGMAAFAIMKVNEAYKKAQTEAVRLSEAIGGSTESIRKLAEFSGKVTAGEAAEKRRENKFRLMGVAPGKTTFGESFMKDEAGVALLKDLKMEVANSGGNTASALQAVSSQLSMAVVSGALSQDQAGSIASQIGLELNDSSFAVKVRAEISELIGPDGTDLATNELVIATRLADTSRGNLEASKEAMNKQLGTLGNKATEGGRNMSVIDSAASGVGYGAGAGIAIGAPFAAATAGLSVVIGAALGAVAGGVAGAVTSMGAMEEMAKKAGAYSGAYVADMAMALQQQNEIKAVLDLTYSKKLDEAAAEGDIAEYKRLQLEYDEKRLGLTQVSADLSNDMIAQYDQMLAAGNTAGAEAVMSGLKNAAEVKFAEDPTYALYRDSINASIKTGTDTGAITGGQEIRIRSELLSGMDPATLNTLLNSGDISKVVTLITNLGGPMATEVGMVANMIKDEELSAKFMLRVEEAGTDSVEAQKLIDLAASMQSLGGEGVMENSINTIFSAVMDDSMASAEITETMESLKANEVETVEKVYEILPEFNVDGKYAEAFNEEYFATLQSNAQKETYILATKMIMEIPQAELIASPDFIAWTNDRGARHGQFPKGGSLAQWQQWYADDMAQKVTTSGVVMAGKAAAEPEDTAGGGGGPQASPLDDILKKLRDVRKSQIEVTKGFDASSAAIDKLFGGDKGINLFNGLEQSMRKFGAGEDLISVIAGMDPEEFEKRKNQLFNFDKQTGQIVGFKNKLLNIGEALSSIAVGEYVNDQQKAAQEAKNQVGAFNQLRAAGYSVAEAYEAVQDAELAAALVSGNVTAAQMQTMLDERKRFLEEQKKLARLTPEGLQEVFEEGFNKAMEAFAAEEKKLTLEFDLKVKDDQAAITAAENEIAKIRYEIDDYEASLRGVEDQEKAINKTYDEKLEALEKVRVANQKVLDQEKGRLSVAEAISRGDLAATARAAQDLRATSASGYFSSQTDALNAGRQSALDQVRGANGLSRVEIEERIEELTNNIFEIEEKTLEPAQERVRLAQVELDKRIAELEVLGKTKADWETIKNNIDLARVNSAGYKDAMTEALAEVQNILDLWNEIEKPKNTVHTITTVHEGQTSGGGGGGGGGGGNNQQTQAQADQASSQAAFQASGLSASGFINMVDAKARTAEKAAAATEASRDKALANRAQPAAQPKTTSTGGYNIGAGKNNFTKYKAMGGLVDYLSGGGSPLGSDIVPAMLTPGEFVVRRPMVNKYGTDFFNKINSGSLSNSQGMSYLGGSRYFDESTGTYNKPAFNKPSFKLPNIGIARPPMPQIPSGPRFSIPSDPGISRGPVRLPDKQAPANNNSSVYNYNLSVNVASQSDPNTIAQTVMAQLQRVESQRVRNGRF
jgi:TP901 family phage tail tape measure protein